MLQPLKGLSPSKTSMTWETLDRIISEVFKFCQKKNKKPASNAREQENVHKKFFFLISCEMQTPNLRSLPPRYSKRSKTKCSRTIGRISYCQQVLNFCLFCICYTFLKFVTEHENCILILLHQHQHFFGIFL